MLAKRSLKLVALFVLLATALMAGATRSTPVLAAGAETFVVTNTDDSGAGSLRQAILDANGHPGPDKVEFNITSAPGPGEMYVIMVESLLPPITDAVVIDGTSQPGYSPRNGPTVEIDGAGLAKICQGPSFGRYRDWPGLDIRKDPDSDTDASGTSILGLKISSFCQGISVSGEVRLDEGAPTQPSYGCVAGGERITHVSVQGNVLEHNDQGNAALDLCNAEYSTVQGNHLVNKTDEIEVAHSEHVMVSGNESIGGKDGVSLVASTHITVQDNTFRGSERGVYLKFDAEDNAILDNHILGVEGFGLILTDGNLVKGNTIVGSGWFGIEVRGGSFNTIEENVVLYNGSGGIVVGAGGRRAISECTLDDDGRPFDCAINLFPLRQGGASNNVLRNNEIAFNDGPGIVVGGRFNEWDPEAEAFVGETEFFAEKNSLLGNSIYANQGLGIDLSDEIQLFFHRVGAPYEAYFVESQAAKPDGPTPNGSGILANHGQNAPVLTSARVTEQGRIVQGSIDAPDPQTVTIELFANRVPKPGGDPEGYGEGAEFLGSVQPDAQGQFAALVPPVPVGTLITATATDAEGNTSEFAANIPVRNQGPQ